MDPDEALARALQEKEEELREARALGTRLQLPGEAAAAAASGTLAFRARLDSITEVAMQAESPSLQERARAVMPLDRLRADAAAAAALAARLGPDAAAPAAEDQLARGLLGWFKSDFFTWVDTLPCTRCGSPATSHAGGAAPGPDDLAGGASRVELHGCTACGATMRFPRYNSPARLLQPGCRRGRCGEWANAFLLCCRAAGLTARYVSDGADHVWTEYYSHAMRRWVHMDPCEASYDQPLLYESGWGKAVAYVVATGAWGATDVTWRYTKGPRPELAARRGLVAERWLGAQLDGMTAARRAGWAAPRRLVWLGRDAEERVELLLRSLGRASPAPPAGALPGRLTGSLQWRRERGETGAAGEAAVAAAAAAAAAPAAARPPTSYRFARAVAAGPAAAAAASTAAAASASGGGGGAAAPLPAVFRAAGWVCGAAVRAAGDNGPSEGVERLFDGRVSTKWLDFGGGGVGGSSWVELRLPLDVQAVRVAGYVLVSANDCPERDPAAWRLEGVAEADFAAGRREAWTQLDARSGVRFPSRFAPLSFALPGGAPSPPLRRVRLSITAVASPAAANSVQLACWNVYSLPHADAGAGPLQRLRAAAHPASGGAAAGGTALDAAAVALAARLLRNLVQSGGEARYRRVRCSKAQTLLDSPLLADALLLHCGFRPLLMPPPDAPEGAGGGEDVFLVLAPDGTGAGSDLGRVREVLEVLDAAATESQTQQ